MRNHVYSAKLLSRSMITFVLVIISLLSFTARPASACMRHIMEYEQYVAISSYGCTTIHCIQYEDIPSITLYGCVEDPDILEFTWGDWRSDNSIDLNIVGKKTGTTEIIVTNSYNEETAVITVDVDLNDTARSSFSYSEMREMLTGSWSPDPDAYEPVFLDFTYDGRNMFYDMYRVIRGNGSGFNLNNETSIFEYNNGYVTLFFDAGYGWCEDHYGDCWKMLYFEDLADGIIYDEDGEAYYKL